MTYYAYKDINRKQIIYADKHIEQDSKDFFYCPNKYCTARMILKSRNGKVKPYFSAIKTHPHIPNCFANFLNTSQTTYDSQNFDFNDFFNNLVFKTQDTSSKINSPKKVTKTDDPDNKSSDDNIYPINTLHELFDFCISHSLDTKINDFTVDDIICDTRNNFKYSKFINGKKLILCKFNGYHPKNDDYSNTFFFKYPINSDAQHKYTIISSIDDQKVFDQLISLYERYQNNPVALLVDCKSKNDKIFTKINTIKQVYVLKE